GDLTSAFRPYNGEEIKLPDAVERDSFVATIHQAQYKDVPQNYKNLSQSEQDAINQNPRQSDFMPQQEPGVKNSNALSYQLHFDGHFDRATDEFRVNMRNPEYAFGQKTRGVPIIFYAVDKYQKADGEGYDPLRAWNYAVAPGDEL